MKVLIIAYWHDPRFREKPGGLIRMYELADNLRDLGHQVTMVLPNLGFPQTQTRSRVVAIPFIDLPFLRPVTFHLSSAIAMIAICLRGLDRVYVRQMNSFLPLLLARMFGRYSYFEIPNDPFIGYSLYPPSKRWLVKLIDRICMRLCDRVVVLSAWSKKRINELGGIPLENILVFPSGTDTELFRPVIREEACDKLGLDPACYYLGFIGSFLPYQGLDLLVDAALPLIEKVPQTRFLLVGDGPMRAGLEEQIRLKGLQERFIITGHVAYRTVPDYIGAMDVCLAPHQSGTNQASPVKLFDYMASGRPIVASDIEVVREIVADSGCAVLVPPADLGRLIDAITMLYVNPLLREQMAGNGRRFAREHYDRRRLTEKLFDSR